MRKLELIQKYLKLKSQDFASSSTTKERRENTWTMFWVNGSVSCLSKGEGGGVDWPWALAREWATQVVAGLAQIALKCLRKHWTKRGERNAYILLSLEERSKWKMEPYGKNLEYFWVSFFKITALLSYNSHTIKSPLIIRCFLVYSQSWAAIIEYPSEPMLSHQ